MAVFPPRYQRAAASHLLTSAALAECDRQHMWDANVRSADMIQSRLLCTGVSLDRAWARGAETDGSSSCRSEHEAPEHSLQSVVPVLNIDRSKAASAES